MPITAPTKPMMKPMAQTGMADEADGPDRNGRDVDLGALEAHLQRQAVHPGVGAGAPQHRRLALLLAPDRADAFVDH
jgi:hypothetical protein